MRYHAGHNWQGLAVGHGSRRSDEDSTIQKILFVWRFSPHLRLGKLVIPVVIGRAEMPRSIEMPDSLKPFARCNAVWVTQNRLRADTEDLITAVHKALTEIDAARAAKKAQDAIEEERRNREAAERRRLAAEKRQRKELEIRRKEREERRKQSAEAFRAWWYSRRALFVGGGVGIANAIGKLWGVIAHLIALITSSLRPTLSTGERLDETPVGSLVARIAVRTASSAEDRLNIAVTAIWAIAPWPIIVMGTAAGDPLLGFASLFVLISGMILAFRRWPVPTGAELALYWVGYSLAGSCLLALLFKSMNWAVSDTVEAPVLGVSVACAFVAATGTLLAVLRRHVVAGTELVLYWIGCSVAVLVVLAIFFYMDELDLG